LQFSISAPGRLSFAIELRLLELSNGACDEPAETRPMGNRSESAPREVPSENGEAVGAERKGGRLCEAGSGQKLGTKGNEHKL